MGRCRQRLLGQPVELGLPVRCSGIGPGHELALVDRIRRSTMSQLKFKASGSMNDGSSRPSNKAPCYEKYRACRIEAQAGRGRSGDGRGPRRRTEQPRGADPGVDPVGTGSGQRAAATGSYRVGRSALPTRRRPARPTEAAPLYSWLPRARLHALRAFRFYCREFPFRKSRHASHAADSTPCIIRRRAAHPSFQSLRAESCTVSPSGSGK